MSVNNGRISDDTYTFCTLLLLAFCLAMRKGHTRALCNGRDERWQSRSSTVEPCTTFTSTMVLAKIGRFTLCGNRIVDLSYFARHLPTGR